MRQFAILVSIVALSLATVLGGAALPARAQDATPDAAESGLPEGISIEAVSFGAVAAFPPTPATVEVIWVRVEPGASAVFPDTDPALGLHVVESGALTLRDFSADFSVTRAASAATPGAITPEMIPAGTEVTLAAGDAFIFAPIVAGEWRNDGDEPAVFTVVLIYPAEPGATEAEETPTVATPGA